MEMGLCWSQGPRECTRGSRRTCRRRATRRARSTRLVEPRVVGPKVVFGKDRETEIGQVRHGRLVIFDVDRQRRRSVRTDQKWVGVVDADLGAEKGFAN